MEVNREGWANSFDRQNSDEWVGRVYNEAAKALSSEYTRNSQWRVGGELTRHAFGSVD